MVGTRQERVAGSGDPCVGVWAGVELRLTASSPLGRNLHGLYYKCAPAVPLPLRLSYPAPPRLELESEVATTLQAMGVELRPSATVDGMFTLPHTML